MAYGYKVSAREPPFLPISKGILDIPRNVEGHVTQEYRELVETKQIKREARVRTNSPSKPGLKETQQDKILHG